MRNLFRSEGLRFGAFVALAWGLALASILLITSPVRSLANAPENNLVMIDGIVRVDSAGHWSVLEDASHTALNITGVSCPTSGTRDGQLVIGTTAIGKVVTGGILPDETYAGRFEAGPSSGFTELVVTIRNPRTLAMVNCYDPALRLPRSNWFVTALGQELPTSPPPTTSAPAPTTLPTGVPTATVTASAGTGGGTSESVSPSPTMAACATG